MDRRIKKGGNKQRTLSGKKWIYTQITAKNWIYRYLRRFPPLLKVPLKSVHNFLSFLLINKQTNPNRSIISLAEVKVSLPDKLDDEVKLCRSITISVTASTNLVSEPKHFHSLSHPILCKLSRFKMPSNRCVTLPMLIPAENAGWGREAAHVFRPGLHRRLPSHESKSLND